MLDWINPLYAYLGLGGAAIAALIAVAIYFPPFRKIALAVAGAIAAGLAIYTKGSRDASKRASAQRAKDEQRAIDRAKAARAGAERDVADDPAGLRDKYNRDNG